MLFNSAEARDAALIEWIKDSWYDDEPFPEEIDNAWTLYQLFQVRIGREFYAWVGSQELEDH